jgi:hypothetical protein
VYKIDSEALPPLTLLRRMQKCVDMPVTLPQYLVLTGEPILSIGQHRQWARRPTETPCKGKSSRRKSLHGNQEKGCEEKKEALTVGET